MIRMKSKLHGFCHAHDKNEEAYLRKLGWIEEGESFDDEKPKNEEAEQKPVIQRKPRKPKA